MESATTTTQRPVGKDLQIAELEAELAVAAGALNAAQSRVVALVRRALAEGLWEQAALRSPSHWLSWRCGLASSSARRLVRLAERLDDLPCVAQIFEAGTISADQAWAASRRTPAEYDRAVAELAPHLTVHQLEVAVARYPFPADEAAAPPGSPDPDATDDSAAAPAPAGELRHVSFGTTDAGTWRLVAELPLDEGAEMEAALVAARQTLFHGSPAAQRGRIGWADALVHALRRSLDVEAAERPHGDRHLVHLHVDVSDLAEVDDAAVICCHLGERLPGWMRDLVLCDTSWQTAVHRQGVLVALGSKQDTVPDRLRRQVEHRDQGCIVPGCGQRRWLQVHHIVHREHGGATVMSNLCCVCPYHHRLHHRGLLHIRGDADGGLVVTDAHGRPLRPPGITPPTGPLPVGPVSTHPSGERWRPRDLHLDPRPG